MRNKFEVLGVDEVKQIVNDPLSIKQAVLACGYKAHTGNVAIMFTSND